jgi:hypothetical protein
MTASTPLPPEEDDGGPQTIGEARKGIRARKPTNKNKSYEVSEEAGPGLGCCVF